MRCYVREQYDELAVNLRDHLDDYWTDGPQEQRELMNAAKNELTLCLVGQRSTRQKPFAELTLT